MALFSLIEHYSVRFDNNNAFDENAKPELPFKSSVFCFRIVGNCNGLLCLFDEMCGNHLDNLLLWNPWSGKAWSFQDRGSVLRRDNVPCFILLDLRLMS